MILIKNAIANMKAAKIRVFAAMLWIIIAITSVVTIGGVATGLQNKIFESKNEDESNTIRIDYYANNEESMGLLNPFSRENLEFLSLVNGVKDINTSEITDEINSSVELQNGEKNFFVELILFNEQNFDLEYGRKFGYEDDERNSIIIGPQTASALFEDVEEAIGKVIKYQNGEIFEVIGIMSSESAFNDYKYGSYERAYLSKKAYKSATKTEDKTSLIGTSSIIITVEDDYDKNILGGEIESKLNDKNGTEVGYYSLYHDYEKENKIIELEQMKNRMSSVSGAITLGALLIGGIGIMNVMYISVAERMKEIGIRRAIGAKPRNILFQFLIESVVITSIGGIIGVIVGVIGCFAVSKLIEFKGIEGFKVQPSIGIFIFAALVSMLIGIIFGVIPSVKASKMDPIKAIKS